MMAGGTREWKKRKTSKGDIAGHDSLHHLGCHHPSGHRVALEVEGEFHQAVAYRHWKQVVRNGDGMLRLVYDSRAAEKLSYRTYPRRPSGSTIGTILIPAGAGPLP